MSANIAKQILVSCEHASNALPEGFHLDPELLRLHIAWDPGALPIAERLAEHFAAPLHRGRFSRLVVDLNRSPDNRNLIRRISDGHRVPFNYGLGESERRDRIELYYRPYRDAVRVGVERIVRREGRCIHVCVHTFTPALADRVRGNDIGLLHDPGWGIERAVADEIRDDLRCHTDYVVWHNRPYSGTADGILPAMRRLHSPETYVGIELEVNQKFAEEEPALTDLADAFSAALERSRSLRRPVAVQ